MVFIHFLVTGLIQELTNTELNILENGFFLINGKYLTIWGLNKSEKS
jgi:hypothetical protein